MALLHMVWMAPKNGTLPEQMEAALDAIRGLAHLPGVTAIDTGLNLTDRAAGATHGALITLRDRDTLAPYLAHPDHQAVGQLLRDISTVTVMDIEV